jgi:hypothetical protein
MLTNIDKYSKNPKINKKKVVIIISGHGINIPILSIGTVPHGTNLIFTNHSSDELESNLEMENIIIKNDYDVLNQCKINKNFEDKYFNKYQNASRL